MNMYNFKLTAHNWQDEKENFLHAPAMKYIGKKKLV